MTAVTHIASDHITINDRFLRQRCGWCGAIIIDVDTARMATPIGQEGPYPTWPVGMLVLMDGPVSCYVNLEGRLPDNFCGAEQMNKAKAQAQDRMREETGG